ncbi:MAG: 4-hydroxy-tetrahydrodipicolinate reductase [Mariprofundaceae bacterium]|nr:4-hydroxy-tetrahydrodipicolinate reductase [Mariprofundaceae bacterium]
MIRVIVTGASGRMGRMLVKAVDASEHTELVGATERPHSPLLGTDAGNLAGIGALGVDLVDDLSKCVEADVLIDFTAPEACLQHAQFVADHKMKMVIGTTGFENKAIEKLHRILSNTSVVMAANYSIGVNLALSLIQQAAQVLGTDYDAEIYEAHHKHKVDAPSGTALAMGRALAEGRQVPLDDVATYTRQGIIGARKEGEIGFSVVRGGNIVGDHKAMFIADEERIEISHVAQERLVFAIGAVRAAIWAVNQMNGWYDMQDVLQLKASSLGA